MDDNVKHYDAIVVGAGFAGIYQLHRLREMGMTARVLEAGSGIGGTWFWNRYPGARCDVESLDYSYSFDDANCSRTGSWSERYATAARDPALHQSRRRPVSICAAISSCRHASRRGPLRRGHQPLGRPHHEAGQNGSTATLPA